MSKCKALADDDRKTPLENNNKKGKTMKPKKLYTVKEYYKGKYAVHIEKSYCTNVKTRCSGFFKTRHAAEKRARELEYIAQE